MTVKPEEDRLYQDPELAQFYDLDNGWAADLDFCAGLAQGARSVLDLGCGTGQFIARMCHQRRAVGVDPAAAMLEIARARPGGDMATWIEGDARTVRLDERFDLIVLTGHAFQVFLTQEDRCLVLETIAAHLAPGGRFIFDTRNPLIEAWRTWTPEAGKWALEHPELGAVECWNDMEQDPGTGIVTYETHYLIEASGAHHQARSRIAFPGRDDVADAIAGAGLEVERWMGDWSGGPCTETSPDIIPLGRPG